MQRFENGVFVSCEDENRVFSVLVEDGGRILFTGDEIPERYRDVPSRVDLRGACVVPAFGDTHLHFASYALFQATLDVRDARNFYELGDAVRAYGEANPREKVILAFGSSAHTVEERRLPNRRDLDAVTSRPLLIVKYDGHAAMANSALLAKLPPAVARRPGFEGEDGWLFQEAFYEGVNAITKSVSPFQLFRNLIGGNDALAEKGIGFAHTSEGVGFPLDLDVDLMRLAARGLPLDYTVFFQTLEVKKALRRKLPRIGGCFATALDGCFGSEDAALREPYTNGTGNRGVLFYDQKRVDAFVREANRAGLQVALHAIGDAAVEQAVHAFEAALKDFPRTDHRHIVIHADLIPEPLLDRAARLGLCLAVQPAFLDWKQEPMEYLERILGDRANSLIPLKGMLDRGLTVAAGSDAPCTLPDPLAGVHAACNHPNPAERISVLDALRMHTSRAARLSFDEGKRGTLTEGKLADFVVLDANPLETPAEKLRDIGMTGLYLRGKPFEKKIRGPLDLLLGALGGKG